MATLNLSSCQIDKKGTQALGAALKKNMKMASSLTGLDLSHDKLDSDGSTSIASFLASPNVVRKLHLVDTLANLEVNTLFSFSFDLS